MVAEPNSPKPRGRTTDGGIPDQEKGGRLVHEWATDEESVEEQRESVAAIMKAYQEARQVPVPLHKRLGRLLRVRREPPTDPAELRRSIREAAGLNEPGPRGRTATGAIPDQKAAVRLVREWSEDLESADEQREMLAHILAAYEEARRPTTDD